MNNSQKNTGLISAIIFVTIIFSGALSYHGYKQFSSRDSDRLSDQEFEQRVEVIIENYIQKQQEEARKAQEEANKPVKVEGVSIDDDAILGDPNTPVTIIDFSDYECPFCKKHYTQVYPKLKEKYIDTGKVKYVYRDFPLGFHNPLATKEAIAAECAREQGGDEIYYKYHDLIFGNTTSNGTGLEKTQLYDFAEQVGVNKSEFTKCLDSEKYKDEVLKDIADGRKYGVSGTPGFFINGWFLKGAFPFESFEEIIEKELSN